MDSDSLERSRIYDILQDVDDYVEIDEDLEIEEDEDDPGERLAVRSAPPRSQWYHGTMSRDQAMDLFKDQEEGAFLVRASITSVGDMTLSFKTSADVKHVKIISHILGDFYVSDLAFASLEDVVEYYYSHPLYQDIMLTIPIPPATEQAQDIEKSMVAIREHRATNESELSFLAGDRLTLKLSENEYWVYCIHDTSQREGWAPKQLLKSIPNGILEKEAIAKCHLSSKFQRKNWLHGRISSGEAKRILQTKGLPGAFLIRESANRIGNFTLSFYPVKGKIEHFRIEVKDLTTYFIGGRQFDCLEEIVLHYQQHPLSMDVYLVHPIPADRVPEAESYLEPGVGDKAPPKPQLARRHVAHGSVGDEKWMEGFLNRKRPKKESWRRLFFAIDPIKKRLEAREGPESLKPKHVLDLASTRVYPLDDSVYGRPNCFQLVLDNGIMDISCDSEDDRHSWLSSFIRLGTTCFVKVTLPTYDEPTRLANLQVTIKEVKGAIKASKLQCRISLNNIKQACTLTKPFKNQSVFFGDQFYLLNLDEKVKTMQLSLHPKKITKKPPITKAELSLSSIPRNVDKTMWIDFEDVGSVRVDFLFEDEILLPTAEYASFKQLLLASDLTLVYLLAKIFKSKLNQFAKYLVRLWMSHNIVAERLKTLAENTINSSESVATLFRGNTLTSKCIELFMKMSAQPFLHACIGEPIDELMSMRATFELDPTRGGKEEHSRALLQFVKRLFLSISKRASLCPSPLAEVFDHIRVCSKEKFPDEPLVEFTSVSAFIFLRFFCPAILNPKLFNLMKDIPTERFARNLTLVAKVVQNLANMTEFGQKQTFMTVCNTFLNEYRAKMQQFLSDICKSKTPPVPLASTETYDLAMLLRQCLEQKDAIITAIEEADSGELKDFPALLAKFEAREAEVKATLA